MKTFTITEEQIKDLADGANGALKIKETLAMWFPAAFEPEWEEVPLGSLIVSHRADDTVLRDRAWRVIAFLRPTAGDYICKDGEFVKEVSADYKIEDGKIWRRKA